MDPLEQAFEALQAGRPAEAEDLCRQITADRPDAFEAWHVLGFVQDALGKGESALASYERALALQPDHAETLFNHANVLHRLERFESAITGYDRALAAHPGLAAAWFNRGNSLRALGRLDEAVESYDRAVSLNSSYAEAHFNRAVTLASRQRHAEALAGFDRVLALRPGFAEAHGRRAGALLALGRPGEALTGIDRALAFRPGDVEAWNARGRALRALGRHDEALTAYDRAIGLQRGHAHALANRGNALHDLKRYAEALASYEAALAAMPDQPNAFGGAADCAMRLCDWERRSRYAVEMWARIAGGTSIIAPLISLAYLGDPALHLRCARTFMADLIPAMPPPLWTGQRRQNARMRIAYLSADFRDHPAGRLIAPVLEAHDRGRFEIIGVSFGPEEDGEIRSRIAAACDAFHDVRALTDLEAARLLFDLDVDIAVDLMGHTAEARMGILAHRPAPVQVSYLGFPGTTAAPFIDYVIADPTILPPGEQSFFTESVSYLPDSYLVSSAGADLAARTPTRAEAGLPEEGLVFCCFNAAWKITPEIFDIWMRLLTKTPGSVLWLSGDNARAEENLRREASARGVDPARLVFKRWVPMDEHLALHRLADLFLDTAPYNAHATASDALAAGLPVLTCEGTAFAGRVAASLLRAAGLPELITGDLAAYEAMAMSLAADPAALAAIRSKLTKHRDRCALFDVARFTRNLEAAYLAMPALA